LKMAATPEYPDMTQKNTFFVDIETNTLNSWAQILSFAAIHHYSNQSFINDMI